MEQEFFDTTDYENRQDCINAKTARVKDLRKHGYRVISSILKNQQVGYSGFGTTRNTSCRDVFMITIL